jgi:hypothetical protein
MGMHMKDGLPGIGVGVEDNPIPTLKDAFKLSNLTSSSNNVTEKPRIPSSKLGNIPIPLLGHNKHMNPSLRPNIPKGKGRLILIDHVSRDLPTNDPFEESLILTHRKDPTDPTEREGRRPPSNATRLLNSTSTKVAGVRGLPRLGFWGFDPQKTQRTQSGNRRSEGGGCAAEDAAPRRTLGVDPPGRGAAGPRGEVPGGVCVFPVRAETVCGALVNESNRSERDRAITGRKIWGFFRW